MTVAVIDPDGGSFDENLERRAEDDFKIEWFSGTIKAGGQHRNKSQNSCRIVHLPTGLVQTAQGRKREANYRDAMAAILEKLDGAKSSEIHSNVSGLRKDQVGSGMRGDKIRTYRFQDDTVVDHNRRTTASCERVMKGRFDLLWK